jgi:hypothetical protein
MATVKLFVMNQKLLLPTVERFTIRFDSFDSTGGARSGKRIQEKVTSNIK